MPSRAYSLGPTPVRSGTKTIKVRDRRLEPAPTWLHWGSLIFNYYDACYTNGVVERMNRSIKEINTAGQGYRFDMLRAKALLCYGNIIPLGDLAAFAPGENDELMKLAVVHGIDPSTLVKALKAGKF